jgi:hypothetical protein
MHKSFRGLVALTLMAATLSACSQAAPNATTNTQASAIEAQSASANSMASRFANAVRPHGDGTVAVKNTVVTLTSPEGDVVTYDFRNAPKSKQVKVTSEGVTVEVPLAQVMETATGSAQVQVLPVAIVPIAISVIVAGAKAYVFYKIKHHGDDFNKHDAIQAVVTAMGVALVHWVPGGAMLGWLVPIVVEALMNIDPADYQATFKALVAKLDKFVDAIKHIIHKDQAPETNLAF